MTIWRTGRHVGRTIYVQPGDEADRARDRLIGMMDTPELAELVVTAVNEHLARTERTG